MDEIKTNYDIATDMLAKLHNMLLKWSAEQENDGNLKVAMMFKNDAQKLSAANLVIEQYNPKLLTKAL